MDEATTSRHPVVAGLGVLIILSTLISGWAPTGPWDSESFTRGLFGLVGGLMLYLSWYRHTFGVWGVIPVLQMWTQPKSSVRVLAAVGIAFIFSASAIGQTLETLPDALSMLILLIGLLILLTSGYAWLVFEGPLADEEE
jgi:peptidoglycan/LPS O-acetylase OafA/YrhL